MPDVDWSSIVDVQVYRTRMNDLKTRQQSQMESEGGVFNTNIQRAVDRARGSNSAFDNLETAVDPQGWQSEAGTRAQQLIDTLHERAIAHTHQRDEQFEIIQTTATNISTIWNS